MEGTLVETTGLRQGLTLLSSLAAGQSFSLAGKQNTAC